MPNGIMNYFEFQESIRDYLDKNDPKEWFIYLAYQQYLQENNRKHDCVLQYHSCLTRGANMAVDLNKRVDPIEEKQDKLLSRIYNQLPSWGQRAAWLMIPVVLVFTGASGLYLAEKIYDWVH